MFEVVINLCWSIWLMLFTGVLCAGLFYIVFNDTAEDFIEWVNDKIYYRY